MITNRKVAAWPVVILIALFWVTVSPTSVNGQDSGQDTESKQEKTTVKEQWEKLAGTWSCRSATLNGQDLGKQFLSKTKLEMSTGKYIAHTVAGKQKGALELVVEQTPFRMKIESSASGKKQTILCIYKFEKDELLLCYSFGTEYPTEFKSTAENKFFLTRYAKSKPEKK